ncbi:hypothetical protein QCA50_015568 [Cerrena zonata]|uniref:Uncharacterized protein n=1 Tax=Cerrena zonata TaxID=2478898 RepID=A0AAW0FL57_9APHY
MDLGSKISPYIYILSTPTANPLVPYAHPPPRFCLFAIPRPSTSAHALWCAWDPLTTPLPRYSDPSSMRVFPMDFFVGTLCFFVRLPLFFLQCQSILLIFLLQRAFLRFPSCVSFGLLFYE